MCNSECVYLVWGNFMVAGQWEGAPRCLPSKYLSRLGRQLHLSLASSQITAPTHCNQIPARYSVRNSNRGTPNHWPRVMYCGYNDSELPRLELPPCFSLRTEPVPIAQSRIWQPIEDPQWLRLVGRPPRHLGSISQCCHYFGDRQNSQGR